MSSKKNCVSNPISQSQIIELGVERECLEDLECGTLKDHLQGIYVEICDIKEPDVNTECLNPESNSLDHILQALINKECGIEDCPTCDDDTSTETSTTSIDLSEINLCRKGTWDCDSTDSCIIVDACSVEPTNEEIIQALVSRVLDLSDTLKSTCEELENLTTLYNTLNLQIQGLDCCN